MNNTYHRRQLISWVLYDLANTIYTMCVVSLYFAPWMTLDLDKPDIWYSAPTSISMLLVAWTLPFLGDYADRFNRKGYFLRLMTLASIAFTCLLSISSFIADSTTVIALCGVLFFIFANYAYQGALVFYNAFLPDIAEPARQGIVSGWGVSIGYVGSIIGIMLVSPFDDGTILNLWNVPGFSGGGRGATFLPAGLLFFLFSIPMFMYLKDSKKTGSKVIDTTGLSPRSMVFPFIEYYRIAKDLKLLRFLTAKFFYEEGIATIIIMMSLFIQVVLSWSQAEADFFFVVVIPAAIAGSALCGYIVNKAGPKPTLLGVIFGWIVTLCITIFAVSDTTIWLIGIMAGVFLGSTWTAARPLLIILAPPKRINECFGLYSFSGKAASIVGPLVWAGILFLLKPFGTIFAYKAAVGSLLVFMVAGFIILLGVKTDTNLEK
ncbi:MFS transporter [candidate division KSB1 bacterium]